MLLLLAGVMSACGGGGGDAGTTQVATLLPTGPVDSGNPGNPGSGSEPGGGGNHQSDPPGGQTPSDPPSDPPPSDPPPSDPPPSDPPPSDPPPSDPPPDPAVGCALLAQCLKVDSASVATYKGGKKAAASYTFDDGTDSSEAIASLFEARGLRASFYIVPSTVDNDQWAGWKDLSRRGHEIGNHSMTHSIDLGTPDLTEATLTAEILDAQNLIASRIGVKPMVFAFPWHSSTAASRAFALKTHLAIRTPTEELPFTLAFFDADHGPLPQALQDVNQQLSETVAAGGWYVAAGHGIDGSGWSPITSQFLNSHLDYARSFGSSLWTDTYLNVARYQICRKQARLNVQAPSAAQMKLTLNGSFDAACGEPLTVKIPLLVNGTPKLAAKDANGASVPVKKIAGAVTVDVLPGQSVTLTGQQ